jgi:hypothetical protein
MSEAHPRSAGSIAPEVAAGQGTGAHDEQLATTRLPPITPPPRSIRPPAAPMSPSTPLAPTAEMERPEPRPSRASSPQARVGSLAVKAAQEERVVRLSLGGVSAGLGLALALAGLIVGVVVGFRGPSMDTAGATSVAVALVVTRGVMVLGMLAFGCALIFFATRLLLGGPGAPEGAKDGRAEP